MKNFINEHHLGSSTPLISMLEYGDFECPYCARFDLVVQKLIKEFPQDLSFTFRHFPMVNIHPDAGLAAMAAEAAGFQNKYWEMHHMLFTHQENLSGSEIMKMAKKLNLNQQQFRNDLESDELWKKIEKHIESGIMSHVSATPSLYLNNLIYDGPSSYVSLKKEIKTMLEDKDSKFS